MKKVIITILFLLLIPQICDGAIAYDAQAGMNGDSSASSFTYSHTVGTGSDRFLVVGIRTSFTGDLITGVTYGGTAMTFQVKETTTTWFYTYIYTLVNPASGANNVVVSLSSSQGGVYPRSVSYTGVHQTSPVEGTNNGWTTSTNTLNTSITTATDNCWGFLMAANSSGNYAAGTGTNLRTTAPLYLSNVAADGGPKTPAGTLTLQLTSGTANHTWCMLAFKPSVAAPSATSQPFNNIIFFE
jgi:hypothetical protein